ncbi:MAG TPA: Ig-like domain-containing protein, partial [Steroidobacteraceae bacterium]|nr:Ig-like domain-containing protein [Steroidobacteraceae bacterium]
MHVAKGYPAAIALLALAACGGGGSGVGGGGGGGPPPALSVTDMTPANGATGVSRRGNIVLTFSTTLDPQSFRVNTVSLVGANDEPPFKATAFSATAVDNKLTITPDDALSPALGYRVTVGAEVRGARGEALSAPVMLSFTTADREWQTPTRIEPVGPTTVERPRVVVDRDGNAIAVWQRRDAATRAVWSNRYVRGAGWGTAVQISKVESTETNAALPEIDVDASGNATVVWEQSDRGVSRIWSNRYTAGTGWGTASVIQSSASTTGDGRVPHVAVDASGNALAVWTQFDGGIFEIWSNLYSGGAWGTPVQVETNPGSADSARVAFDFTTGRAFAVWTQGVATCLCVWSNQFTLANGWGTPRLIATATAGAAFLPQIAVDGFGNAHAVWTQSDESERSAIWANRFTAGGDWGTAVMIDDNTSGSGPPKIFVDSNANAYAVWEQASPNERGATIRWNRFESGTGWGAPGRVASATDAASGTGGNPAIAVDGDGVAHVVWEHDDGVQVRVRSSRLLPQSSEWAAAMDAHNTDSAAE